MKTKLHLKYQLSALCGIAFALSGASHAQTFVDLSDTSIEQGIINDAIFTVDDTHPSGTGVFKKDGGGVFLTIQKKGVEEGYNTSASGVMDTKRVPQWNHELTFADLSVEKIDGRDYASFFLDINESASSKKRLLSLDDVKVFSASVSGLSNPTVASLVADPRTTLHYDMDQGGDSTVLLDYGRNSSGSGTADMAFLVPLDAFKGVSSTDYIYLYSKFGGDLDGRGNQASGADAGFEEWASGKAANQVPIPEPSSTMLIGLAGISLLLRRKR